MNDQDSELVPSGQEGIVQAVFPPDQRRQVPDTKIPPWNAIGRIDATFKGFSGSGTGFVIAVDRRPYVLTAAHNFYSNPSRKEATQATFKLALDGAYEYATYRLAAWKFPDSYIGASGDNDFLFDYALASLADGTAPVRQLIPTEMDWDISAETQAMVVGYPADKDPAMKRMYFDQGGFVNQTFDEPLLFYRMSTSHGMSGGPVLTRTVEGRVFAIGVHTMAYPDQRNPQANCARRIDTEVWSDLTDWALRLHG
jgi:V8-like Glu-specific endopeptidase